MVSTPAEDVSVGMKRLLLSMVAPSPEYGAIRSGSAVDEDGASEVGMAIVMDWSEFGIGVVGW
jgi:hypothetical protein